MWWDMAPERRREFEDWHTHEHFPERLGIPGFLRSSRWTSDDGTQGVFVLYELRNHAVLSSPGYLERLNSPTPWSTRLMPHHRNMVRSQNEVLESRGAAIARTAVTLRLSPSDGREDKLRAGLKALIDEAFSQPGLSGAHLLRHRAPPIATTTEQMIRGGADGVADWTLMVCAYDAKALEAFAGVTLADSALQRLGARSNAARGTYTLASSATPSDVT